MAETSLKAPLISVVIPAKNASSTLEAALRSLARQKHRDWEAIIVDDQSGDDTFEIASNFAARDGRFRVIAGEGRGASAARNRGIAQAQGHWLQFLDADDWLPADYFTRMLAALRAEPEARAAWCSFRRIMPDGQQDRVKIPHGGDDPFPQLSEQCIFAIHGVLTELALVREVGGFDENLITCEDWDLWQRIARTGVVWAMVPELVVPYRIDAASLSNRAESLIRDGIAVIERGGSPDPRVPEPALRWRDGLAGWVSDMAHRKSRFALWPLSVQAAAGKPVTVDPALLGGLSGDPWLGPEIGHYIFDGLVVGLRSTGDRLLLKWDKVGPAIQRIMAVVAQLIVDPMALRRIDHSLDDLLLQGQWPSGMALRRTLLVERESGSTAPVTLPAGIDRVHCRLIANGRPYASLTIGALGALDARDFDEAIAASLLSGARWRSGLLRHIPLRVRRGLRRVAGSGPARRARALLGKRSTLLARPVPDDPASEQTLPESPHREMLEQMRAQLAAALPPPLRPVGARGKDGEPPRDGERSDFWEKIFAVEDPWNYDSPYEQEKYERQMALLPDRPILRALELASAEGHFTRRLAPRVGHLLATDISGTALERNRARHEALGNVTFQTLDLAGEEIPAGYDLIFCSEVLYYLDGFGELRRVAGKVADALEPGGTFITAHAFVLTDDRDRTGFDWGHPFGAEGIARTFAETPGMALEATIETEIYRIDRFRKLAPGETAPPPVVEHAKVEAVLEPDVERYLLRGGAALLRTEAAWQQADRVPILMYHGVADEGPEDLARYRTAPAAFLEQIRWLRRNGYHSLPPDELLQGLRNRTSFAGRPVVITFDDGIANFAENAWPILRAHDFSAEMFVVTGMAGRTAEWDGDAGRQVPLLDVPAIRRLATEGVRFGSHFTRHVPANGLTSAELAHEMLASRLSIGNWLGEQPVQLAAPYTIPDPRFPAMARSCGYSLLYGNRSGAAGWWDNPLDLPRIEVPGDWSLDQFVAVLEGAR
jgi:peptidoglycan/xylan/chitin deacetylase (PgdA/CDA1 family)/GT2 family glycosyltransferase/SAM-dependent methyltransferase